MIRVVLSGGIGAGKSTAASLFGGLGAATISADEVGHEVIAPGGPAFGPVAARWPETVNEGEINRAALARIVFADEQQLAELEAMTHPAIADEIESRLAGIDAAVVVVEIPLLHHFLGEGWLRVVVDAPDEVRRARLRERGFQDDDIARRMASQPDRGEWLRAADHVVDNSGGREQLEAEVRRVWDLMTPM